MATDKDQMDTEIEALLAENASRLGILLVDRQVMESLFKRRDGNFVMEGLPDDAQLLGIHAVWDRDQYALRFQSSEFDPVEPGQPIPNIAVTVGIVPQGFFTLPAEPLSDEEMRRIEERYQAMFQGPPDMPLPGDSGEEEPCLVGRVPMERCSLPLGHDGPHSWDYQRCGDMSKGFCSLPTGHDGPHAGYP
jgi:hypothetical protein